MGPLRLDYPMFFVNEFMPIISHFKCSIDGEGGGLYINVRRIASFNFFVLPLHHEITAIAVFKFVPHHFFAYQSLTLIVILTLIHFLPGL